MMTSYGAEDMIRLAEQINILKNAHTLNNGSMRIVKVGMDSDEPSFLNCMAVRFNKDGWVRDYVYGRGLIYMAIDGDVGTTSWCGGTYDLTSLEASELFNKNVQKIIWTAY